MKHIVHNLKKLNTLLLLLALMGVSEMGWGQSTLVIFNFESLNLNPSPGAIGSPVLTASSTVSYFGGSSTSPSASACFASANSKYFELTISTLGYTGITINWNARTSSTTSSWVVTGDYGAGFGSTLATQNLSTSFASASPLILSSDFSNKSSIKIRWTANVSSNQTIRIDDIIITGTSSSSPTKLSITSINPTSPTAGSDFSITVQAQDESNNPANVANATAFTLTTNGNAGTIGGTTTGTIQAGTNSVTVTGVTLSTAGTGATITATRTSGDNLTAGTSSDFNVLAAATQLAFVGVPSSGTANINLSNFTVEARRPDNTLDNTYTANVILSKVSGSGAISGTTTKACVAGVATFNDIQFNAGGVYTISAASGSLTGATTGNITILAAQPTNSPTAAVFSNVTTTSMDLSWTAASGGADGYIVIMRTGSSYPTTDPVDGTAYTAGTVIGNGTVVYSGNNNSASISTLAAGSIYSFEVFSYNGSGSFINYRTTSPLQGQRSTLASEPTTQTTAITFSNVTATSMTIGWTSGNGSNRLVLVKAGSPVDAVPVDGTAYTASTTFGNGTQIGTDNYVVYVSTGSSVTISGLSSNTAYYVAVFEFNGSSTTTNYLTTAPLTGSQSTIPSAATSMLTGIRTDGSINISWTNGNGTGRIVVARLSSGTSAIPPSNGNTYLPNSTSIGDPLNPTTGTGNIVVYNGTGSSVTVTGLTSSTNYRFDVYEYYGSNYSAALTSGAISTLYAEPTLQTSLVTFSNIGATSFTIGWTNGNGSNRIVLLRSGSSVNSDPIDGTAYTANPAFSSGSQIGTGNYVVYNGTGTSVNVTGLSANTTYYAAVYEFGGSGSNTNYLLPGPATGNQITLVSAPSAPTNLTFNTVTSSSFKASYTAPVTSPTGYLVLRRTGSAVTGSPAGGSTYTEGGTIGTGTIIYLGATAWNNYDQTGLIDNTTYHYAVYSYGGSGNQTNYSAPLVSNQTTSVIPAPNSIATSSLNTSGFVANWDAVTGAGSYRLDVSPLNAFGSPSSESDGLENASTLFTISGGSYYSGSSGSGDLPASSPFYSGGSSAYGISSGTATLASGDINTSTFSSASLTFRLASFSVNSNGNGAETEDFVTVEISPNGGTDYYSTIKVKGNSNSCWAYSTGTGIAITNYDGDANPIEFAPSGSGNRTTDGFSTVTVNGLPITNNMRIRVTLQNNSANERWLVDDFTLSYFTESFVSGYENLTVNSTNQAVTGLTANTPYFYRVRAVGANSTSTNSNVITVTTGANKVSSEPGDWNSITWSPAGVPVSKDDVTINHAVTLTGQASCHNLTIGTGGSLTVNSDGSLLPTGTATGTVTLKRNVGEATWTDPADGWHLLSSPVAAQVISPAFTETTLTDYDFFAWDEASNMWLNQKVAGNNITTFAPGKGYLVSYKNGGTKSFTGALNVTDQPVSLSKTGSSTYAGYNLIGNPFSSAITWGTGWTLENTGGVAYVWDESGKDYISRSAGDPIPAMNGFMVYLSSGTSQQLTIPASARQHNGQAWFKSSGDRIVLHAIDKSNNSFKENIVRFKADATENFDLAYDGYYLQGYAPKFYSVSGNEYFSVNTLPEVTESLIIPLGFEKTDAEEFAIEMKESIPGAIIFLTDKKTNTVTNLTQNPVYSFTAAPGDDASRFSLHFASVGLGETPTTQPVLAYYLDGALYVNNTEAGAEIMLFGISGQLLKQQTATAGLNTLRAGKLSAGVYVVRVQSAAGTYSSKVIVTR